MNILYLTNELNYTDGVSSHLYYLLTELKSKFKENIFIATGGGDAIEKFESIGAEVFENNNLNHKNRGVKNFASAVLFITKLIKEKGINIIHSHTHYAANIAYRSSKFAGIKTIQTVHGIIPATGRLKHFKADVYVTVNDSVMDCLNDNVRETGNKYLIYNGIDPCKEVKKIKNKKLTFVSASRLDKGKNTETFIKAIGALPVNYREKSEFIIAGEGDQEKSLLSLDKELKTGISFIGRKKNLRELLNKTDVFIMTSINEGFPMTILEAGAAGNLIISSDFSGIENIIKNNSDGLIFKTKNHNDLADKMKFAFDNAGIVKEISGRFHQKILTDFNANIMAQKYSDLYNHLING